MTAKSVPNVNMAVAAMALPLLHPSQRQAAAVANKVHPDLLVHLEMMVTMVWMENTVMMESMAVVDKCFAALSPTSLASSAHRDLLALKDSRATRALVVLKERTEKTAQMANPDLKAWVDHPVIKDPSARPEIPDLKEKPAASTKSMDPLDPKVNPAHKAPRGRKANPAQMGQMAHKDPLVSLVNKARKDRKDCPAHLVSPDNQDLQASRALATTAPLPELHQAINLLLEHEIISAPILMGELLLLMMRKYGF